MTKAVLQLGQDTLETLRAEGIPPNQDTWWKFSATYFKGVTTEGQLLDHDGTPARWRKHADGWGPKVDSNGRLYIRSTDDNGWGESQVSETASYVDDAVVDGVLELIAEHQRSQVEAMNKGSKPEMKLVAVAEPAPQQPKGFWARLLG